MDICVRRAAHRGVPVLHVAGDLDLMGVHTVRRELTTVLRGGAHPAVVVDLTHVRLIDSAGLGVLVGVHKQLAEHGGSLSLVVTGDAVLRVLRISALARLFDIFGDMEAALTSVGARTRRVLVPS